MNEKTLMLIAEVLDEGLDDWITLSHVLNRASNIFDLGPVEARGEALAAIKNLLVNGMIVAGNIGDSGFEAWNLNPLQAFDKILTEGRRCNWMLGLTDIWIATTEKGDTLGRLMNANGAGVLNRYLDLP